MPWKVFTIVFYYFNPMINLINKHNNLSYVSVSMVFCTIIYIKDKKNEHDGNVTIMFFTSKRGDNMFSNCEAEKNEDKIFYLS